MEKIIYLDNNATTRTDPEVLGSMLPFFTEQFANSASTHYFGTTVNDAVKIARNQVATLIGCESTELIFTSGATESINLALKGIAESYQSVGKHIISVKTEHRAVLDTCQYLERKGYEITYLNVNRSGLIDLEELQKTIRPDTILVSVMMVNNETGIIQNVKGISQIVHKSNAFFMTDATQAVGKIPVDVEALQIDLMPFSAHKLYGPKGIGALYIRQKRPRKIKLESLQHGGGHEKGMRSGTLNVPGIIGFGKACEIANTNMANDHQRIKLLKNELENKLVQIDGAFINGGEAERLYTTISVCFPGIDSDALIAGLCAPSEIRETLLAVSNGSACTAASIEPSHVLTAMGLTEQQAFNTLRISLGRFNNQADIDEAAECIIMEIQKLNQYVR